MRQKTATHLAGLEAVPAGHAHEKRRRDEKGQPVLKLESRGCEPVDGLTPSEHRGDILGHEYRRDDQPEETHGGAAHQRTMVRGPWRHNMRCDPATVLPVSRTAHHMRLEPPERPSPQCGPCAHAFCSP
jgi:hypothetical protein